MAAGGPLLASAGWRQALVATLYAYQGLVAGCALTALPNHAASLGASTTQIGLYVAAIGFPWIAQPLWGPVVDRFGGMRMGRRRFWVLLALAGSLMALSGLFWVGEIRPGGLGAIAAIFTAHSFCAALMDTATDAMIIDHTPTGRLGAATACTRAGFVSGLAVGGVVFAWVLPQAELAWAAILLLVVGLLAAVLPLLVRETPDDAWFSLTSRARQEGPGFALLLAELGQHLTRPAHVLLLLFCLIQDFLGAIFRLPLGVFLIQEGGWAAASLSSVQSGIGLAAGTLGAWVVGTWTDRVGPARALAWLLAGSSAAHLLAGVALGLGGAWAGPLALSLSGITSALCFVALAPAVMQASRGAVAASRFALYMAALNLGDVLGSGMAGPAGTLGVPILGVVVASGYGLLAWNAAWVVQRFRR